MKPLTPSTPHAVIMVGIPGAGKTHFASHFAQTFQAPFVHTGALEAAGASHETALTLTDAFLAELLKTKKTLVFEGPTHNRTYRHDLAKKVRAAGYKPLFVWVQTETTEAKRRSTKRGGAYTPEAFDDMVQRFHPPASAEQAIVMSGKHTYATQVKLVLKHLSSETRPTESKASPRIRGSRNIIVR